MVITNIEMITQYIQDKTRSTHMHKQLQTIFYFLFNKDLFNWCGKDLFEGQIQIQNVYICILFAIVFGKILFWWISKNDAISGKILFWW
jgi:hypothetical protein